MNRPTFPIAIARALAAIPEAWAPGVVRLRAAPPGHALADGTPAEECDDWLMPEGFARQAGQWDPLGLEACARDGARGWAVPDLEHPATVGALLGVYRTLTGDPRAYVMFSTMVAAWVCCARGREPVEDYTSDGRAVALAILREKGIAVVGGGE